MKIAIDCGHGSNTAGKRTPALPFKTDYSKKGEYISEHAANVRVGKYLTEELLRNGFTVYKSAFGDEDISITKRQKNIKNAGCDLSISIHFNAFGDGKTFNNSQGIEVLYHNNTSMIKDSKKLANVVLARLVKGAKQKNRGLKTQGLGLCNCAVLGTKASILVELAFMTNEEETRLIGSDKFLKECAVELAQGVCDYVGKKYSQGANTSANSGGQSVTQANKKYIKILVDDLNVRKIPSWDESAICGTVNKNEVYTVIDKVEVGNGVMYKLKSGVYVTGSEKFVKYY